jgi:hypothetical protein
LVTPKRKIPAAAGTFQKRFVRNLNCVAWPSIGTNFNVLQDLGFEDLDFLNSLTDSGTISVDTGYWF